MAETMFIDHDLEKAKKHTERKRKIKKFWDDHKTTIMSCGFVLLYGDLCYQIGYRKHAMLTNTYIHKHLCNLILNDQNTSAVMLNDDICKLYDVKKEDAQFDIDLVIEEL